MKTVIAFARFREWWRKDLRSFLVLAAVLFAVRSSLADWNDVPTGSMKPTILEGDRIFINKLAYDLKVPFTTAHIAEWAQPQRGEIVVFYSPYDGKRLVKRVAAVSGDTLELKNDALILNGKPVAYSPVPEDALKDVSKSDREQQIYAFEALPGRKHLVAAIPSAAARRDFGPFTVPPGQYFMMGDNRDDSFDSRYYGTVPRKSIVGRASVVALSVDRQNYWLPRWDRFLHSL